MGVGKRVGGRLYIHRLAVPSLDSALAEMVSAALAACPAAAHANVLKIDEMAQLVSALEYPDFFETPFPALLQAWHIRIVDGRVSYRSYEESTNPPILHRKELLLPPDHPGREAFAALTAQAEALGLFADSHLIGFALAWENRIARAGYYLSGHQLLPLGNDIRDEADSGGDEEDIIARHRTALSRSGLSAPVQALLRHELLTQGGTFFDYGCGRGDDVRGLQANGFAAEGWDPHYAAGEARVAADVVNLGFVVNVIEDFDERVAALRNAFQLARQVLAVAVMLYGNEPPAGRPYRDGYRTQRNTFQKYFTQSEFKEFVETALDTEAVPVGPGILLVFAHKMAEQRFLFGRQRSRRTVAPERFHRLPRSHPPRAPRAQTSRLQALFAQHQSQLDALWECCLELGREPHADEFDGSAVLGAAFGSWRRVLKIALATHAQAQLETAVARRRDDLLVFLALLLFERRQPYRRLEASLQRDIKAHFGDYPNALLAAQQALKEVAQPALLDDASREASERGLGYYVDSDYLQMEAGVVSRLPARLRIYVGCASVLYGDLDGVDVVKIHLRSGKLSLLKFDDFHGKPLPLMTERVKIRLRDLDIDFFRYDENPPPLYYKRRYLNEEAPRYAEQVAFDESLEELRLFDPATHGPSLTEINAALASRRLMIQGFSLVPAQDIPDLDAPCGANFRFRDFIECGETWQRRAGIDNRPKRAESYNALHALAINLLDPVIDYFGMIRLTYGFASPALTRQIPARIAPVLDQHAACEVNRLGKPICPRRGAAVDFLVEDEDMLDVARWIASHLAFDRMYVYGPDRPLHLSHGPDARRQVTVMLPGPSGNQRLYPRTLTAEALSSYVWPERNLLGEVKSEGAIVEQRG
mgnify:CR=1 FL=1